MLYVIGGVTASGKSSLALRLAEKTGGEIVNADSLQQYRDFPLLTCQPDREAYCRVPHHGYARVNPELQQDLGAWLDFTLSRLTWLRERGRSAIVCGGTGLYLESLLYGVSAIPKSSVRIVRRLESMDREDLIKITAHLHRKDKEDLWQDRQRMIRSSALMIQTGRSLRTWQKQPRQSALDVQMRRVITLLPDRKALRPVVERRLRAMIAQGLWQELGTAPSPEHLPRFKPCGLQAFTAYLAGTISLQDALARATTETLHYAKRQSTWFRNRLQEGRRFYAFASQIEGEALTYMLR